MKNALIVILLCSMTSCLGLFYTVDYNKVYTPYLGKQFSEFVHTFGAPDNRSSNYNGGHIYEYHHYSGGVAYNRTDINWGTQANPQQNRGSIRTMTPTSNLRILYVYVNSTGMVYKWVY